MYADDTVIYWHVFEQLPAINKQFIFSIFQKILLALN